MKRVRFFLSLLVVSPSGALAQLETEQRGRWERFQAAQRIFEHRLFTEAGFAPISEVRAAGRHVRRLLLHDPYMILPVPGIEVERSAGKRLTLRLQYRGWTGEPVSINPAAWQTLASHEQAVFAKPQPPPARDQAMLASPPPTSPPAVCHGWIARFEADEERTASWSECGSVRSAAYDYAAHLIELAINTRADCAFEPDNAFWSFNRCFAPKESLDDPKLEATFAVLRKEFGEAPGAERLAEARRALNTPGLTLGNQVWMDARAAIAKVQEVDQFRRYRLQKLEQLAYRASDASSADKAKMRQTIENWSDFVRSQERNYSELLRRLVWVES